MKLTRRGRAGCYEIPSYEIALKRTKRREPYVAAAVALVGTVAYAVLLYLVAG